MPEPSTTPSQSAPRPVKQEKLPATDEVVEVAPGVLRSMLPISMPGLGHVNCYLLEDERGVALVDPGLPGKATYDALRDRLRTAGIPLHRVHSLVITHSHPDHFGGANRLREETGADIITMRNFSRVWNPADDDLDDPDELPAEGPDDHRRFRELMNAPSPWGGKKPQPPFWLRLRLLVAGRKTRKLFATPVPTVRLRDAEVVKLARREWVAIHTPGHTHDHLCLYDPVEGVVFSGDHVLPTITPHIGGLGNGVDPLDEFFSSLERMCALEGVRTVLPAHGNPFTDLCGRAHDIQRHHHERLEMLRHASADLGEAPVEEYMKRLFNPRVWNGMAESETYAHLEHLRLAGRAETRRDDEGRLLYRVAAET